MKYNGRTRYAWKDRFLAGDLGISLQFLQDGSTNQQYSLSHRQDFSQRTKLTANLNYVTNTTVQRNTTFNPYVAVQVISSQLNFSTGRGPFSLSLGGTQQQFPGRAAIDRSFPSLSITSKPIVAGEWLTWTPGFSLSNTENLHIDRVGDFAFRYVPGPGGALDSIPLDRNSRSTTARFDTPVQIFGFSWRNSFSLSDKFNDFPSKRTVVDVNDTTKKEVRVYNRTYLTEVNWETDFSLPSFAQGTWNISPHVSIQKVDPHGLLVRSERTGNTFVANSLRPAFGLSVSPTLYRRFPGIGRVAAIRHSISPSLGYQFVPEATVSDEFLEAVGSTRIGYLGANRQNTLSLGLNTTFEAKLRPGSDSLPEEQWQKIKLLMLTFSSLGWDFERAKVTKQTGLTNTSFGMTARSDLLPGFDIGVDWSLFQGDPISDTAVFKPFRDVCSRVAFARSGVTDRSRACEAARHPHERHVEHRCSRVHAIVGDSRGCVAGIRCRPADRRFDEPDRVANGRARGTRLGVEPHVQRAAHAATVRNWCGDRRPDSGLPAIPPRPAVVRAVPPAPLEYL